MKLNKALAFTSLIMATMTSQTKAADYTLRLADALPPKHVITRAVAQPFMDLVKEKTGGAVEFQHFPAGQLGKGEALLNAVNSGLAEIGYIIPSHMPGRMPLGAVAELSGGYPDACTGTKALLDIALPGGLLDKLEFAPAGVRTLAAVVLPPYQVSFRQDGLEGIKAIDGKKLRSNPGPMEMTAETLGGVPVRMTPSEIYDSLEKGTIDGFFLPYVSILSYKLQEIVKTSSRGANFGSVVITYGISQKKFDEMPPEIQTALTEAGKEASISGCEQFDAEEAEAGSKLESAGVAFLDFDGDEGTALNAQLTELGNEWARLLDERGNGNAKEILAAFRKAVDSHMSTN